MSNWYKIAKDQKTLDDDLKESSVSSQQVYTRNDVIQNRQDIAPSRLRRLKLKKKKKLAQCFNLSKTAGRRDDIKREGSVKVPLPESSEYVGVHVYTQAASNLYGAGTQWCTTGSIADSELKAFPNVVYFIHKTMRIEDDPADYKLALDIDSKNNAFYTYDAQNNPYPKETMLKQLSLSSFDSIWSFIQDFWQEQYENGYFDDLEPEEDEEIEDEEEPALF